jgi:outer membrane protein OmpA-like peptidoglycan-associated protein
MMNTIYAFHLRYPYLALMLLFSALHARGQEARFILTDAEVAGDSLYLGLKLDFSSIRLNSRTCLHFTPILANAHGGRLELPPVLLSGRRRYRFDRREWALNVNGGKHRTEPYLIQLYKRHSAPRPVSYHIGVPYSVWMGDAALLLRQEVKDCCDLQLLGVDTISVRLFTGQMIGRQTAPVRQYVEPLITAPSVTYSVRDIELYASMLSFLEPTVEHDKKLDEKAVFYIDYPLGSDNILPDYRNNRTELQKLDSLLSPLSAGDYSSMEHIRVCGYASPDGTYIDNERLATSRAGFFASYICSTYGIPRFRLETTSVAEDWEGLSVLLQSEQPPYAATVLSIIQHAGIFNGREKQLMDLRGGEPYRDMLHRFFPRLRRLEVSVRWNIRAVSAGEAYRLIYTHPEWLSLSEMYGAARYYRPGTEQYREVYEIAAYRFPEDMVANINASSAVMLTGDVKSARAYLQRVESDPRSWNNLGVLALMEGNTGEAEEWFRKAVGVEPQKARRNLQRLQRITVTDGRRLQGEKQVIQDKRLSVEDKSLSVQDDGGER